MNRSILHCDMNNFYASVECMLDPSLRKYPVAVCGSVEERHGIVLAKNYAAKSFDVKTGDAVWQAKQKCKDLVVVPPHYEEYIKYSKLARNVYSRYTDQVEPYGMDECWLDKELQRVNRDALEKLNEKGIILKFPAFFARTNTALVLKEPKTKTSTRKVFLPKTVAEMLKERYQEIQEYKELFGDEFQDFNLVFCNANGRPMESQIITRALQKLIKDNDLPPVVFHSLRHSSITYKLKLNGGDIKSVQGDSGHAQVKMVTDVYSHIIDEDRRLNAQRFEETFYQKKNPSEVNGATVEPKKEPQGITEEAMLNYMVQNPDFLQKFKVLLGVGN